MDARRGEACPVTEFVQLAGQRLHSSQRLVDFSEINRHISTVSSKPVYDFQQGGTLAGVHVPDGELAGDRVEDNATECIGIDSSGSLDAMALARHGSLIDRSPVIVPLRANAFVLLGGDDVRCLAGRSLS